MSLIVSSLLSDAKDEAFPYLREELSATGPLLRHLTRLDREIVSLYALQAPERLSAAASAITVVAASNAAGYALQTSRFYSDFRYYTSADVEYFVEIVPEGKSPSRHPAAYVRGSTLYPADPFKQRWAGTDGRPYWVGDGDEVTYRYVPQPAKITATSSTLVSPDEAEQYIIAALVFHILLLYGAEVPPDRLKDAQLSMLRERQVLMFETTRRADTSSRFGE